MTATTSENNTGLKDHTLVFIIYALLIAAFYSPVLFSSSSLVPSLNQPHGVTASGVYGEKGRTPVTSFNVDMATPAYYEFPVNKLVGDIYREGNIPLWNPYQGGGTPLAAQYSTRAFFPYQILEDISPVWSWDYFILGRLLIAGFFTYLFMSAMGAGSWSAFAAGLFYMFSGVFTWFINLEQLVNTAMMLPVLLLSIEFLARGKPGASWVKVKIVFAALCFALTLLAGQPATALYVLTLALLYYLLRSLTTHGLVRGLMTIPRLAIAFVTGLALSSPLLLLFLELVDRGAHIHHAGGLMGVQRLANWRALFNVLTPTLSYFPADPDIISGTSLLVGMGDNFFRFLTINGLWDTLGGYTGVLPLFLILSGIFISPLRKKIPMRKEFFFFLLIAAVILLKNAGIWPFILLGKLPLFDIVWSLRWAGPVWVFSISVAAALGLAMIERHLSLSAEESATGGKAPVIPRGVVFILAGGVIVGAYILYSFVPSVNVFFHRGEVFNETMRAFIFPSIISGSLVTLIVIGVAFSLTYFWRDEKNIYALIILAILELWWCIPRGYAPETLLMKWAPLGIGLLAVSFFFRSKVVFTFMALVVFFTAFFFMDSLAPQGYPPRDDPFRTAPYVSAIMKDSAGQRPRVAGAYGALMPNFAGVVKLDDIRYVNSVVPEELHSFRERYLYMTPADGLLESSLWFTGRPEGVARQDVEGKRLYRRIESPPELDFIGRERGYSMLGVRYFIFPGKGSYGGSSEEIGKLFEEKFPLIYDKSDARVYKNAMALPRVFLAANTLKASSWEEAQKVFMEGEFDPLDTIVVEEDVKDSAPYGGQESAAVSLYRYVAGSGSALGPASAEAAEAVSLSPLETDQKIIAPDKTTPAAVSDTTPDKHPESVMEAAPEAHPESVRDSTPEAAASEKSPELVTERPDEAVTDSTPEIAPEKVTPDEATSILEAAPEKSSEAVIDSTPEIAPEKLAPEAAAIEDTAPDKAPEAVTDVTPDAAPEVAPVTPAEAVTEAALPVVEIPFEEGARIRSYGTSRVVVEVKADKDSVLVLGDVFYPGWKAKVDGVRTKIIRVNGLVRGVPVKAGSSSVVFYYLPLTFILGLVLMGLAGIFCIFLIFKDIKGD